MFVQAVVAAAAASTASSATALHVTRNACTSADCTADIVTVDRVAGPSQSSSVTFVHRSWGLLDLSPDRSRVAFVRELKLFTATVHGEDVRQLADGNVTAARWSPNGDLIAFTAIGARAYCGSNYGVWVVSASGGEPRELSTCAAYPAWAPDSKTVAFVGNFDGRGSGTIARAAVDGSNRRDLAAWSSTSAPTIAWAPRGGLIAFTSGAGTGDVRIVHADGTGNAVAVRHATLPAWRPDGRRLAVVLIEHAYDRFALEVVTPAGAGAQRVDRGKGLSLPTWSLDGRLAYVKAPLGAPTSTQIYVAKPGAKAHRVTAEPGNTAYLGMFWSRDGKRLLYLRCRT